MPTNTGMDLFVAGVLLDDVGGLSNTGLDAFVAGVLYATVAHPAILIVPLALAGMQAQVGTVARPVTSVVLAGTQAQVGGPGLAREAPMQTAAQLVVHAAGRVHVNGLAKAGSSRVVVQP